MRYIIKPLRPPIDLWRPEANLGWSDFAKTLREVTGCSLKEAIDAAKAMEAGLPVAIDASTEGRVVQALTPWCSIEPADATTIGGIANEMTEAALDAYTQLREAIHERAAAIVSLWGGGRDALLDVSFEDGPAEISAMDRDGDTFTLVVPRSWFTEMPAAELVKSSVWANEPGRLRYTYMGG